MPSVACIRPNSSKVVEFISSWIALGSIPITVFVPGDLSVLNPKRPVSLTRTRPSQRWSVLLALQLLLEAKPVPYAEL